MKKTAIHLISAILCAIAVLSPLYGNAQTAAAIKQAVNEVAQSSGMTNASISVNVYNITKKQVVYGYQPKMSLIPGSLNKIFTTAVGFDKLGSKFRFKTRLLYDGTIDRSGTLHGNLYIVGGGDPMLGSYRFKQTAPDTLFATWKRALEGKGIHKIDGRIYYNSAIFDNYPLHDSWQWGDVGNYFGAGAYGLNFHENMYFVYFDAGKRLGYPASVNSIEPKNLNVRGHNEVTTGNEGSGDQVVIYGDPQNTSRRYCGTVPLNKKKFPVRGAMPSPPRSCAELFAAYLRTNSINVSNNVTETSSIPDSAKTLIDIYSNTYYVIAQYTNQTSNNIYAESIFKYLGFMESKKGSFANGTKCINNFFKKHNLNTSGVRVVDGCGLSRNDLVTADFMCRFLTSVYGMPIYNDFHQSLAKVHESGTARNLLKDVPDNIEVRLKSGTLSDVKSYAGYVINEKGETLCFCIISNNHTCSTSEINSKMEKILRSIALYRSE